MKKLILFLEVLIILSFGTKLSAQTTISGGYVSGDWNAAGSPYLIEGELTVHVDSTLNIGPGVEVNFQGHHKLIVNGWLYAEGVEGDSILFTAADTVEGWHGIRFIDAPDSSHLYYCVLQYGRATGTSPDNLGGAIYCYNSSPTITGCTISENVADWGGGIICNNSNPTFRDCKINDNAAIGIVCSAGGISLIDSNPIFENCIISGNVSNDYAGGIYCNDSSPTLENCIISDNIGVYAGGGICCLSSETTLLNCTFSGNSANWGGGIYFLQSDAAIENCTISNNTSESKGGGVYVDFSSDVIGVNNIIWANSAPTYSQIYAFGGNSFACTYSDIQDGWTGTGNINADPLFYSTTGDSAYYLTAGSPCIDAGDPNSPAEPDFTIADIGAFYYDQGTALPSLSVTMIPLITPILIPAGGGSFEYNVLFENNDVFSAVFNGWIEAIMPDGSLRSPIIIRHNLLLAPGETLVFDSLLQYVPGSAPEGEYSYVGNAGIYPEVIISSDSFTFEKLPGDNSPNHNLGWALYGWDNDFTKTLAEALPIEHNMFSAYPNPFNNQTVIKFSLPTAGLLQLVVYDVTGREVIKLVDGYRSMGTHETVFDAAQLSSGIYFARLTAGDYQQTRKLLLVK